MDDMRTVNNGGGGDIAETPPFLRAVNAAADARQPAAVVLAEDLQRWDGVTRKDGTGLGFDAQWNDYFVDTVRAEMNKTSDASRCVTKLLQSTAKHHGLFCAGRGRGVSKHRHRLGRLECLACDARNA